MPIEYKGRKYSFDGLAKKIAKDKGWPIEKARAYVAGIEKNQQGRRRGGV